jgi:hypothetical protein
MKSDRILQGRLWFKRVVLQMMMMMIIIMIIIITSFAKNLTRIFGRPRRRGKDNIKVYIKEYVNMVHMDLGSGEFMWIR